MDTCHMVGAELLKLRRRSLLAWTGVLTVGASVAFVGLNAVRHRVDPTHYGPAGGATNLQHAAMVLRYLGTVAAVLVGTTAGGQDQATGMFRDLVTTGTSRTTLFLVRLPAALAFYLVWFLPAYAVAAAASIGLAGALPTPPAWMVLQYGLGLVASTTVDVVLAVGLAATLGSRTVATGILLGWELAFSRLLEHVNSFGSLRQLLTTSAIDRIFPALGEPRVVPMTALTAGLVLTGWAVLIITTGTWRTATRDA